MDVHRIFFLVLIICGCDAENKESGPLPGGGEHPVGGQMAAPAPAELSSVGYRDSTLTYVPMTRQEERVLPIHIWYPTNAKKGAAAQYQVVFERESIYQDAPTALKEPAPLLVFSHGRRGFGQYSYFLAEYFAERGWIVVAMDHIGDRLEDQTTPDDIFTVRPLDIKATIDHMMNLPSGDPLKGYVAQEVVVAGHSFGGYTAFGVAGARYDVDGFKAQCPDHPDKDWCKNFALDNHGFEVGFRDERIKAAIIMAPGNQTLFKTGVEAIDIPVLLITAGEDKNNSDEDDGNPYWETLRREPNRRLRFRTGGHFTFTNICDSVFSVYGEGNGCGDGFIEPNLAYEMVNQVSMAFVNANVFDDKAQIPVLNGRTSLHPDVEIVVP